VSSIVRSSMLHPNSIFRLNVITFKREPSSMKENQGLSLAARCDILDQVLASIFGRCSLHSNSLPAPRRETNTTPYAATPTKSAWRRFSPFLLVIGVVLLLVVRYFSPLAYISPSPSRQCAEGLVLYKAVPGDDCWTIANSRGWNLEKLQRANGDLKCSPLSQGASMCVPPLS
jgi:hypothetical protein